MRPATHLLHSMAQLDDPDNAALLRECGALVVAPEWGGMDNLAESWGRIVEAAPHARLLISFNAKALYFGDRGRNAWWQRARGELLARTRPEDGTPAFIYRARDWGGDPHDAGDPTPHLGLIEPTLENAEALAAVIRERVDEVRGALPGIVVDPYIDDAPRQRPARLRGSPRDAVRWAAYLTCLIGQLPYLVYTNCAGNPPAPFVGICCEYPSTRPSLMMRLTLEDRLANSGFEEDVDYDPPHILWGGEECAGLWRAGRYLR